MSKQQMLSNNKGVCPPLKEIFFESPLDSTFKERIGCLNEVRKHFIPSWESDLSSGDLVWLRERYVEWLQEDIYGVFEDPKNENRLRFHKLMKRGNNIHCYKLKKVVAEHTSFLDDDRIQDFLLRKKDGKFVTNIMFATLTWDPKIFLGNRNKAWRSISYYYNSFITKFRQKYGKCWVFKVFESTKNGYPHIHLLMVTEESFECFQKYSKQEEKYILRVRDKKDFAVFWNSFIDVRVPYSISEVKRYITKDLLKQFNPKCVSSTQRLMSLALCWLYRKRSFSISHEGMINEIFPDLIQGLSITQISTSQQINEISENYGYIFKGIVGIYQFKGEPPPDIIEIELNSEDLFNLYSKIWLPYTKKKGVNV